jgi:hypothetical protein
LALIGGCLWHKIKSNVKRVGRTRRVDDEITIPAAVKNLIHQPAAIALGLQARRGDHHADRREIRAMGKPLCIDIPRLSDRVTSPTLPIAGCPAIEEHSTIPSDR